MDNTSRTIVRLNSKVSRKAKELGIANVTLHGISAVCRKPPGDIGILSRAILPFKVIC